MRIEIHLLQNFAPSCLNRDDTNSPKDCEFGGYRRARISSQCQKRAVRQYFSQHNLIPAEHRATRTKRLWDDLRQRLARPNRNDVALNRAITTALAAGGLKLIEKNLTQYLLFLGQGEISKLAAVVDEHFDILAKEPKTAPAQPGQKKPAKKEKAEAKSAAPEKVQQAVAALLDGGKAADLALFGRMLADLPERNVDAACQVAHAISTNKVHSMEMDYYTAVDDLKPGDTAGADMIGTVEFNSSCFYRYANLDIDQLTGTPKNNGKITSTLQGDRELAETTTRAFLTAFVHALPTGKQNTFAAHNPPSLVFAVVRQGQPVSLANAFVKPITVPPRLAESLVVKSVQAMDDFYGRLTAMFGDSDLQAAALACMEPVSLRHLLARPEAATARKQGTVKEVIDFAVSHAFAAGRAQ